MPLTAYHSKCRQQQKRNFTRKVPVTWDLPLDDQACPDQSIEVDEQPSRRARQDRRRPDEELLADLLARLPGGASAPSALTAARPEAGPVKSFVAIFCQLLQPMPRHGRDDRPEQWRRGVDRRDA